MTVGTYTTCMCTVVTTANGICTITVGTTICETCTNGVGKVRVLVVLQTAVVIV